MNHFLSRESLLAAKPAGLVRAIERLLIYSGFDDVRVVDGANDNGADLVAAKGGQVWVIQSKWTSSEQVDDSGVNDCERALRHYKADRALLVTNAKLAPKALSRIRQLEELGISMHVWDGETLESIYQNKLSDAPSTKLSLRNYQSEAVAALAESANTTNRSLLVLATGLGKTVVASTLVTQMIDGGARTFLVMAHLKELVEQLERAFWASLGKSTNTQVLHGDSNPNSFTGVTFATPESALKLVELGYHPDVIIVDECHHVGMGSTYAGLLDHWDQAVRVGLTATPWRGDKFDIESYFGPARYKMGITEGMAQGWLSNVDYRIFTDHIDWAWVQEQSKFGYSIMELNRNLFMPLRDEKIIEELRGAWNRISKPQAIVFCPTIEHAERITELLRRKEPAWRNAQTIHSEMPKRDRNVILNNFRARRVPVIACVDVFNEGVDVPDVSIIAFLRVTHSRRIFVQQLGRGLRLSGGKEQLTVLDFVSDIRRLAAVSEFKKSYEQQVELFEKVPQSNIEFEDATTSKLIDYWLADAADLETAHDDSRLNFPSEELFEH